MARDSRLASSTSSVSLWQSVFSEFCTAADHTHNVDSEGAHHQLINGYAADKCMHSARSTAHHTHVRQCTPRCVLCFFLSKLSSCEARSCLRDGSLLGCFPLVLASCSVSLLLSIGTGEWGQRRGDVLHGHRLRSVGALEGSGKLRHVGVYGCPILDTFRTSGDEVLVTVFRQVVLFLILSCEWALGI